MMDNTGMWSVTIRSYGKMPKTTLLDIWETNLTLALINKESLKRENRNVQICEKSSQRLAGLYTYKCHQSGCSIDLNKFFKTFMDVLWRCWHWCPYLFVLHGISIYQTGLGSELGSRGHSLVWLLEVVWGKDGGIFWSYVSWGCKSKLLVRQFWRWNLPPLQHNETGKINITVNPCFKF